MENDVIRLAAPVSSAEDVRAAAAAGANEVYCGALFDGWAARFGVADVLSRRQGRPAHARTPEALAGIAESARALGRTAALALNGRYTAAQEPYVLDLAGLWEEMGGAAVIATDPGVALGMRRRFPRLRLYVSSLAGVFNASAAAFFVELGATRIILPRDLSIGEITAITRGCPRVEYEALVFYQKCPFMDGFCGFHHDCHLPAGFPAQFDYETSADGSPVLRLHDPLYEGHGCGLAWQSGDGPVRLPGRPDDPAPHCAACRLDDLHAAGVGVFKLAGRGYPPDRIALALRFLCEVWRRRKEARVHPCFFRETYRERFEHPCQDRCYYRAAAEE